MRGSSVASAPPVGTANLGPLPQRHQFRVRRIQRAHPRRVSGELEVCWRLGVLNWVMEVHLTGATRGYTGSGRRLQWSVTLASPCEECARLASGPIDSQPCNPTPDLVACASSSVVRLLRRVGKSDARCGAAIARRTGMVGEVDDHAALRARHCDKNDTARGGGASPPAGPKARSPPEPRGHAGLPSLPVGRWRGGARAVAGRPALVLLPLRLVMVAATTLTRRASGARSTPESRSRCRCCATARWCHSTSATIPGIRPERAATSC